MLSCQLYQKHVELNYSYYLLNSIYFYTSYVYEACGACHNIIIIQYYVHVQVVSTTVKS